jgi:hypothetical protein
VKLNSIGVDDGLRMMVEVVLQSILGEDQTVSSRQLEKKELPQFIKNSFQAIARKQVKNNTAVSIKQQRDSAFDQVELKVAHDHFMSEMQKSVVFSESEVKACIYNALKIRYELLLHPRQASEAIFFKKHDSIDKSVLLLSLQNFGESVPFLEKLCEKVKKLPDKVISKTEFEKTAKNILSDLYSNGHRKTIVKDSTLFVDFFKFGGGNGKLPVDTNIVEEFFHARGLDDVLPMVREKANGGKDIWTRDEMLELLKDVVKDTSINFNGNGNGNGAIHPRIIFENDFEEKIRREKIERQPPGPYPSLLSFIKNDDWKFLLKKVFQKNSLDFAKFIYKIDRLEKWRDAKAVIDWELEQRKVDMYAKEAVRLGDLVFAKFFQKGEYI